MDWCMIQMKREMMEMMKRASAYKKYVSKRLNS
jgi:hypothetical protein